MSLAFSVESCDALVLVGNVKCKDFLVNHWVVHWIWVVRSQCDSVSFDI
jgi:hypothetical protein